MMTNIKKWYDKHSELKEKIGSKLNKDDLYTLYSLQDGVSRLKYEDESRGHGTMNFIRAFITLGSFGKENPDYKPHLNIISGKTCVHCDNDVEPYCENNNYLLSLNKEKIYLYYQRKITLDICKNIFQVHSLKLKYT